MNHKRKKPKSKRAPCACKFWKHEWWPKTKRDKHSEVKKKMKGLE